MKKNEAIRDNPFYKLIANDLTDESFNDVLKVEVAAIQESFRKEEKKGMQPFFHVICFELGNPEPKHIQMDILVEGGDEEFRKYKNQAMEKAGAEIAKDRKTMPLMCFLTTEAWMRHFDNEETEKAWTAAGSPDEFPEMVTTETLITCGMTLDTRTNCASQIMHRTPSGIVFLGSEPNWMLCHAKEGAQSEAPILESFYRGFAKAYIQGGNT